MEWTWGLPRGGLAYYLTSPRNAIIRTFSWSSTSGCNAHKTPVRSDMADMLCHGHFILFPTFKTYKDAMDFSERAGVKNRQDNDRTPRRPLTAVRGLYLLGAP